ncbi:ankyrin repeat domain-containing protein [Burkholderia lata]|uniref:ankyrin repeat domain-containing protein n=1 Tax=Burkholderia lata (strain ATCC 17760 / DSM 23089 / LMG 22485 / NCIMB 9086 / R18194 / 383) TaxID=482957 RepID=UPI0015816381|nr:ankyrin repeat domain-containing protein [Burkholderia lata]
MAEFSSAGERHTRNGAVSYGKCPHVGKDAYLHTLYRPLASEEIAVLEERIARRLPQQLVDFYGECNGFHYFVDTLIVYGLRAVEGRGEDAFHQPYDMKTPNVDERIHDAEDDVVFFGWYDWDGSLVYMKGDDSRVFICKRESVSPIGEWRSLKDFLSQESERISGLFDSDGMLIDATASTLPVVFGDIYECVSQDDVKALEKIFDAHPDFLNVPIYGGAGGGLSLLHRAAAQGRLNVCRYLLEMGISVDVCDENFLTPLVGAASAGHLPVVQFLFERGASVNGHGCGVTTPLIDASMNGHGDVVVFLIERHANLDRLQRKFNQTALDAALVYRQEAVVHALQLAGARRSVEAIDLAEERGSGILEHIYHKVGPILIDRNVVAVGERPVESRAALIKEDKSSKLLFTIGLFEFYPRLELMFCVESDWPLAPECGQCEPRYRFPGAIFEWICARMGAGVVFAEGDIIESDHTGVAGIVWPEGIDALLFSDYSFDHDYKEPEEDGEDVEDSVKLLLMTAIKLPKSKKLSADKVGDLVRKTRNLPWKKVKLPLN